MTNTRGPQSGRQTETTAAGLLEAAQEKAQDVWDSTRQGVEEAASAMAESTSDAWDQVCEFMGRSPVATFLAGVGLGTLLTMAFGNLPGRSSMIRAMERSPGAGAHHPYGA